MRTPGLSQWQPDEVILRCDSVGGLAPEPAEEGGKVSVDVYSLCRTVISDIH